MKRYRKVRVLYRADNGYGSPRTVQLEEAMQEIINDFQDKEGLACEIKTVSTGGGCIIMILGYDRL